MKNATPPAFFEQEEEIDNDAFIHDDNSEATTRPTIGVRCAWRAQRQVSGMAKSTKDSEAASGA